MSRYLAIEWDSREARVAVASARAGAALIEQAFAVSLPPRPEGAPGADPQVGQALGGALAARRLGRMETLLAVGRASIELKQLSLPPAPAEELPDLVRFQAQREFNSLDDDWPLDFLPLGGDGAHQVLAAAISPDLIQQIHDTCHRANIKPARLVLRPCAAASLLCRQSDARDQRVRLLVDLLADEADLTVLIGEQVVFLRTARLPASMLADGEECRPLLAEIRRTIAAAQNQLGGEKVEAIHLCGSGEDHAALAARMEAELKLSTRLFDPFAGLELAHELAAVPPQNTGRFAPLLGMLLDEVEETAHGIDFLNPRRRPPPVSRRRTWASAAAAAGVLALLVSGWIWFALARLDKEIARLDAESKQAATSVDAVKELDRKFREIDAWAAADVIWLDELRELSAEFPESKQAMLTMLRMGPNREGGEIQLEGLIHSVATIDELETSLRDTRHRVVGRNRQQDSEQAPYIWRFQSTVIVAPPTAPAGVAQPPRQLPGDSAAPSTATARAAPQER